jgi:hypothetical protein
LSHYEKELEEMKHMSRQEFIAHLRRYGVMHTLALVRNNVNEQSAVYHMLEQLTRTEQIQLS